METFLCMRVPETDSDVSTVVVFDVAVVFSAGI